MFRDKSLRLLLATLLVLSIIYLVFLNLTSFFRSDLWPSTQFCTNQTPPPTSSILSNPTQSNLTPHNPIPHNSTPHNPIPRNSTPLNSTLHNQAAPSIYHTDSALFLFHLTQYQSLLYEFLSQNEHFLRSITLLIFIHLPQLSSSTQILQAIKDLQTQCQFLNPKYPFVQSTPTPTTHQVQEVLSAHPNLHFSDPKYPIKIFLITHSTSPNSTPPNPTPPNSTPTNSTQPNSTPPNPIPPNPTQHNPTQHNSTPPTSILTQCQTLLFFQPIQIISPGSTRLLDEYLKSTGRFYLPLFPAPTPPYFCTLFAPSTLSPRIKTPSDTCTCPIFYKVLHFLLNTIWPQPACSSAPPLPTLFPDYLNQLNDTNPYVTSTHSFLTYLAVNEISPSPIMNLFFKKTQS
ncbi:hypothetical protein NEHOM01_0835 [Nematocida homosporus]|uniref:uncharacterized protein n=1 Tax=Nematocida homosporus TaxID=1912981 RepID=UPI00221F435C|nr:uncharacterized protein NEHOM01_0835 [Nematocida homosporus]KAI5185420.1 hypothetical protein NEHOM01_0835 [Nematocida homosporus]